MMKVFEPLSRYSSPSRFARRLHRPNASEPESGSVIAHAPILSNVSRSSAHRSFCAVVPLLMIAAGGEARSLTPIAVTMPGRAAAELDDRQQHEAALAAGAALLARRRSSSSFVSAVRLGVDALLEAVARHLVHAEGREELAEDVVRRRVAVLELLARAAGPPSPRTPARRRGSSGARRSTRTWHRSCSIRGTGH